jgi:hypothetical protein
MSGSGGGGGGRTSRIGGGQVGGTEGGGGVPAVAVMQPTVQRYIEAQDWPHPKATFFRS